MKYVKMLGLAAVAAMALVALLSAGSASATILCVRNVIPCTNEYDYQVGTYFDISLEEKTSVLRTTGGTLIDTCTESAIEGNTTTTGSEDETVDIKLTEVTFGGCTNTTTVLEQGELEVHYAPSPNNTRGTLTAKGVRVAVTTFGVNCTYGAAAEGIDIGTVTGGAPATIDIVAIVPKVEGSFLCPADGVWEAKYVVTEPQPLYIKNW